MWMCGCRRTGGDDLVHVVMRTPLLPSERERERDVVMRERDVVMRTPLLPYAHTCYLVRHAHAYDCYSMRYAHTCVSCCQCMAVPCDASTVEAQDKPCLSVHHVAARHVSVCTTWQQDMSQSAPRGSKTWHADAHMQRKQDAACLKVCRVKARRAVSWWSDAQMRRSLKDRSSYGPFWYRFEHGESGGDVWCVRAACARERARACACVCAYTYAYARPM